MDRYSAESKDKTLWRATQCYCVDFRTHSHKKNRNRGSKPEIKAGAGEPVLRLLGDDVVHGMWLPGLGCARGTDRLARSGQ